MQYITFETAEGTKVTRPIGENFQLFTKISDDENELYLALTFGDGALLASNMITNRPHDLQNEILGELVNGEHVDLSEICVFDTVE